MSSEKKIKYLSFGTPMMDIIVDVDEEKILKYNLEIDNIIHVSREKDERFGILEKECNADPTAGGCSHNTLRVFNWVLTHDIKMEGTSCQLGALGDDYYGDSYLDIIKKEKIIPLFEKFEGECSSTCLVFCYKGDKGHLTDLACSVKISEDYVNSIWVI